MLATVVIPAFNRPAFLKICCEYILKADLCDRMQYVFCLDYGYDKRCLDVINDFPLTKAISTRSYQVMGDGKQSNNVLTGLLNASKIGLPVFYVEDDVFIGKDFFTFGLDLLKKEPKILCGILSKNHNQQDNPPQNADGYYVKLSNQYQGIGSIFNPSLFMQHIAPHVVSDYILNTRRYCRSHFPSSALGTDYSEQDGLIRRIIEKNNLLVAFSCVPRCFHAGFFGYHRFFAPHVKKLPLDKQVEQIKGIAFNVEQLRSVVRNENLIQDSLPCDLETQHTDIKKYLL
jgi:hypothetical protein